MTTQEFSNTFDTLLNSYASQAQFGEGASNATITLDEYEKSVLLTQAQDIIIKQYFQRTQVNDGFDESERRQVDFSNLIAVQTQSITANTSTTDNKFAENSWFFELPTMQVKIDGNNTTKSKVLFILNEKLVLKKDPEYKVYTIVPINYHEYDRQMSKPFAQPLKKQAWRLLQDNASTTTDGTLYAEIVPTDAAYNLTTQGGGGYSAHYKIRYIRRPRPIVLTNLEGSGLSIDGVYEETECELNPILHMDILNKAVELALTTRGAAKPSTERPRE